jgi:hypothetical protein
MTNNMNDIDISTAFERLFEQEGHAAYDILNERIEQRMKEGNPDFDELDACDREHLWNQYLERYTGSGADELLTDI